MIKKIKKRITCIVISVFFVFILFPCLPVRAQEQTINISPVVQLISYRNIYGKYVEMLGWGSASIINKEGVIISNNHVVDDGKGKLATAFSVCLTKVQGQRPVCDYTATLISRDDKLDIALLKIDPQDINGQKVDYSQFQTIKPDFNYVPKTQDEIVLIGYPWIGADTITETKGIVSGVMEYNNYQYIKTDALIAGGNSGGAMINSQGKLIGIPTFSISDWGSGMAYGLYLKEAQKFIEENINKQVQSKAIFFDFPNYQKNIDQINKNQAITDDLFNFKFDPKYEIKNYIPNRFLQLSTKKMQDIAINNLTIELLSLPLITNNKHFLYYANNYGGYFYDEQNQKLIEKKINGLTFYTPIYKNDVSQGDTNWSNFYFTQFSPNSWLVINLEAPTWDEKNNKKIKKEIEDILVKIFFKQENKNVLVPNFDLPALNLKIKKDFMIANDREGFYRQFFGNLYEYFNINLQQKDIYNGKGKTAQEIYKVETQDINQEYKSLINLKGHQGYIFCEGLNVSPYSYNVPFSFNYYSYIYSDENGLTLPEMKNCYLRIIDGITDQNQEEYFLNINFKASKNNISKYLTELNLFLTNTLELAPINQGETKLVNIYKDLITLKYNDLENQTQEYRENLRLLIKYKLLANEKKFTGEKPMKWQEVLPLYLKANYNIDCAKISEKKCKSADSACLLKNCKSVLAEKNINWHDFFVNKMKIKLNSYIPQNKFDTFKKIVYYQLADVNLNDWSDKALEQFTNTLNEKQNADNLEKIKTFDNAIYSKRKITLSDIGMNSSSFYSYQYPIFSPKKGIIWQKSLNDQQQDFNQDKPFFNQEKNNIQKHKQNNEDIFNKCFQNKKNNILSCLTKFVKETIKINQEEKDIENSYSILTKANFYNHILNDIDLGLFDSELAKKKDVIIESENDNLKF
ncbi:trypsin-like peptidase domain-containing protein [Candidatus Kuenenbacteria bacterium]|nr:trypsin-like peptidase domain-containing protein [Candidatus Kuenenbacteria bacterium]